MKKLTITQILNQHDNQIFFDFAIPIHNDDKWEKLVDLIYLNDWEVICEPVSDTHQSLILKSKIDSSDFTALYIRNEYTDNLKGDLRKAKVKHL